MPELDFGPRVPGVDRWKRWLCEKAIFYSPPASGLIKMKANWAIKEKHVFMVICLESSTTPLLLNVSAINSFRSKIVPVEPEAAPVHNVYM